MPRFSANLGFLWPDRPLLQRLDAAAAAGFSAVEFHWPYDTPAEAVRDACDKLDLSVLGVNTVRGDPDRGDFGLGAVPGRETEFEAAADQAIEWCAAAGGTAVHAMAGKVATGDVEHARDTFCRNLRATAPKAADSGLTVLLEPINQRDAPGYFCSTIAEAESLIRDVGAPNVKITFDVYHIAISGEDVLACLERYLGAIGHVQIAAVPSRHEPDEGEIAYRLVFDLLDRLNYGGWIGCEYKPRAGTDAGLSWFERLGVSLKQSQIRN